MKSKAVLAGVVAAAIAVGALLMLWPRSTGHEEPRPAADAPEVASSPRPAARPESARGHEARESEARGNEARESEPRADGESVGVADHRGETPSLPRRHRPGEPAEYVVQPTVIAGLRRALQPEIERCSEEHGQGLAPGATIQGALEVTVRSGMLSVLSAKVEQSGVPASSELIECARRAFAGAELRAEGHPDVDRHVLRLPFKVAAR